MISSITQVLLTIDSAFQEELVTDSGLKLYLDSSYRKEWHVAVTATIAALPSKCTLRERKILDQLKVGDTVAISYMVVSDFEFKSDAPNFMPYTQGDDRHREWTNAKGEWLRVMMLPGKIAPHWVGYYMDARGEIISGAEGRQSDVERWLSQFPIGKTDIYTFNNFFEYEGKDYWKCGLTDIFAKKVGDQWESVSDRVLCAPIDFGLPPQPDGSIIDIQQYAAIKLRFQDRALVVSGGESKGIERGDIVSFDQRFLEKYEFDGKPFYLIDEARVLGKWQKEKYNVSLN